MTAPGEHKYGPLDEGTTVEDPMPNDHLRVGREDHDEPEPDDAAGGPDE